MSFKTTTASRRRRFAQGSSSSRRLSAVVNTDVLHDVTFHVTDEFERRAPVRRHSISTFRFSSLDISPSPLKRTRAVSETIHISRDDQKALLERWDGSGTPQRRKLDGVLEDEESDDEQLGSMEGSPTWVLVCGLFSGYLLSSLGLQKLNDLRPGCGQLVTLLQYVATIAEKAPHARMYLNSPSLPMHWHASFVLLMFLSIKMGNASLGVGLPFGLFLVIKNTNLAWSLLLGLGTGRSFTTAQILSIGIVTAGISICVIAQNQGDAVTNEKESVTAGNGFLLGALLCAASTFCMAALGSLQEIIFARYKEGHEASESLFFTHLLGLPLFAFGGGLDKMHYDTLQLLQTPGTTFSMLALNISCTLAVKQCFVQLLEGGESVTATLTLTVARMTGVILSEFMESSSTPLNFWLGALLVAVGSLSYATGGRLSCRQT